MILGLHITQDKESNSRSHFIFSVSSAYAYINHFLSVFVEDNWAYPAVAMHEIGHNLGLVRYPWSFPFSVFASQKRSISSTSLTSSSHFFDRLTLVAETD